MSNININNILNLTEEQKNDALQLIFGAVSARRYDAAPDSVKLTDEEKALINSGIAKANVEVSIVLSLNPDAKALICRECKSYDYFASKYEVPINPPDEQMPASYFDDDADEDTLANEEFGESSVVDEDNDDDGEDCFGGCCGGNPDDTEDDGEDCCGGCCSSCDEDEDEL